METAPHHWIPPSAPQLMLRWDADGHVFALEERGRWTELGDLQARFQEGVRMPAADAADQGLYRPSSIHGLSLRADGPARSGGTGLPAVAPGDVVLSKFLPVRAAWVTPATPRRAVDANCVRICGLPPEDGFWIANVLEHPRYQRFLARRAKAAVLPRVGVRDLKALRVPTPPDGLGPFLEAWLAASESLVSARREAAGLQTTAEDTARSEGPERIDESVPGFYPHWTLSHHSWAPSHVALRHFLARAEARGWPQLAELSSHHGERLRERYSQPLRVLRLSDVDDRGGFELPEVQDLKQPAFRVYAEPLRPGEVLLSVLGSSPKVVFHHPPIWTEICLADHWIRFEVPEPGALALLLRTSPVGWQLGAATTGAWRQFVPRAELARVRIPRVDPTTLYEWDRDLRHCLEQIAKAQAEMEWIRAEVAGLVDDCMGGDR